MKITLIAHGQRPIPPSGWGAVERGLFNLDRELVSLGHETRIVNTLDPGEADRLCSEFAPDVVHLHAENAFPLCLPYLDRTGVPLVFTSHDWRLSVRMPKQVEACARRADVIIAISPSIKDLFLSMGFSDALYIPNGVDTHTFKPLTKRPRTVLAVGRNTRRKRFADIAAFFSSRPEYELTIAGPGVLGGMDIGGSPAPEIPRASNVRLLDNQPEAQVARLMGKSEFFVHLCEKEGSALSIREAMSAGCRVWTVPYNAQDLENVALSWEAAVADPELGVRAAREARERFDWSIIARQVVEAYERALSRRPSRSTISA